MTVHAGIRATPIEPARTDKLAGRVASSPAVLAASARPSRRACQPGCDGSGGLQPR